MLLLLARFQLLPLECLVLLELLRLLLVLPLELRLRLLPLCGVRLLFGEGLMLGLLLLLYPLAFGVLL